MVNYGCPSSWNQCIITQKLSCIRNALGKKYYPAVEVTEDDKEVMDDVHLTHLRSEFGV